MLQLLTEARSRGRATHRSPAPASPTHSPLHQNPPAQAAPGVTFNKDYLYDGPWRVLWKTNTAWQRYFDPLKNLADNRAYQWYKKVRQPTKQGRGGGSLVCWLACTTSNDHGSSTGRSFPK